MTTILALRALLWLIAAGAAAVSLLLLVAILLDHPMRKRHPIPAEKPAPTTTEQHSLFAHPRALPPRPAHQPDTTETEEAA